MRWSQQAVRLRAWNRRSVRRRAMTLPELVIVVVILGLLSAIAVPRISSSMAHHRATMAAKRLVADLELARQQAVHTSSTQTVTFSKNGYVMAGVRDLDRSSSTYKVDLADEPYRAQIVAVDFNGEQELAFDIHGVPGSGGTIVVRVGEWDHVVYVDPVTGRATADPVADYQTDD